ncbi:transcriptional regulator family: Fungal Specific TF [Penicillium roqueforti]|nr:transcriptional regulator family: Fungal Specific TF [Penicillium roqueforti]KAI3239437.1 transcriptional regulator family: Fungal Specific TF [Penicillium roqueforti]KAI3266066.1 transcriptional regulator family: Fungal Specific TF [Penicillium roqueforti]
MEGSIHRFRVHRNSSKPETRRSRGRPADTNGRKPPLPACRRCRQQKKRCTRTDEGSCKPCLVAWLPCSLMERSASPQTRERELQSRIVWLSQLVNETLPAGRSVEDIETGRDIALGTPMQSSSLDASEIEPSESAFEESHTSKAEEDGPISVTAGRKCLQAYFRHVHRTYPFLDSELVLRDFETLANKEADDGLLPRSAVPTRLYMIMAIGFTSLQRAGEVQSIEERDFQPCLKRVLCECVCQVNEQSVGTLLLLGLYLLFVPCDQDPRAITGVLTSHALAVGLMNETPTNQSLSPRVLELRRRLGWSVYVFTRMISISYGLPFAFPDSIMRIPLPSIMIHEYGSEEGHQYAIALQVSRHVISLRRLETRIVNAIYDPHPSMRPQDLRLQIEDWYTQGCLLSSSTLSEQDQLPFHTTITWLNVRYQNLLLLLYTPAQGDTTEENLPSLKAAAQQYIQLSLILHEHRHLPMNWIILCRLLSLAAIFLYCTARWAAFDDIPEIDLLVTLFELFPSSWHAAHEASRILRRLADITTKQKSPLIPRRQLSGSSVMPNSSLDTELGLQSIQDDLAVLLRQTMGEASFYIWPLRSKVTERRVSQSLTMHSFNFLPDSGNFATRVGIGSPADDNMGETAFETHWMNLLGGVGSDML